MNLTRYVGFCLILMVAASASWGNGMEMRTMRFKPGATIDMISQQSELRVKLFKLMKMDDLVANGDKTPFDAKEIRSWEMPGFTVKEMTIHSTPGRAMEIVLTTPKQGDGPYPAVVCIGGHSSNKFTVYTNGKEFGPRPADTDDDAAAYKGFASELAKSYVTISTCVSQHDIREDGRTLMGERLWDLMRCVSYLQTLPSVRKDRIGCAGLSLGGEMAMWLAAMDPRIAATVSCGWLTKMDHLEQGHCMCWKFDGLRDLVEFSDIFCMIAPRPVECQNGRKEAATFFTPELAEAAMTEIRPTYDAFGKPNDIVLHVHDGAHEVDAPALLSFLDEHLKQ